MLLRVIHAQALTPSIRSIRLASVDGTLLPGFEPGAHVEVRLPLGDDVVFRKYSLISDGADGASYEIAVKRSDHGRGGSLFMHDRLSVGDTLDVSAPVNEFSIAAQGAHHVLIAGGIGITPMLGIAARLKQSGASYELHYASRSAADMAFHDRVTQTHAAQAQLYFTRVDGARRLDIEALLARHRDQVDTHLYVCGPAPLIDALRLAAEAHGVNRRRIHFESFGPSWAATDGTVRVAMSESAIELDVAPGTTLLDAMEAAGAWIPSDCKRGECGACIASYSGGRPIHRDNCLTEAQRQHSFCPCVSWASSDEVLTLQL
ncbi:PDR/VanB family oxidoreductase [Roseateles chitinivorans]|uniref:PDR/VanB family oxidoreductase n=1 Tax=Roseateles chitinivorans TaxID=2917965 RepID=UPI003D67C9B8